MFERKIKQHYLQFKFSCLNNIISVHCILDVKTDKQLCCLQFQLYSVIKRRLIGKFIQ